METFCLVSLTIHKGRNKLYVGCGHIAPGWDGDVSEMFSFGLSVKYTVTKFLFFLYFLDL